MNDFENKDSFDNQGDYEASARAEKIRAIRESLRTAQNEENAQNPAESNGAAMGVPTENVQPAASNAAAMGINHESPQQTTQRGVPPVQELPPVKKKSGKKKKKKKTFKQKIRGLFPEKGDKPAEVIRKIFFLISVIAVIVCGYLVADYYLDLWNSRRQYDDIAELYQIYEPEEEIKEIPTESPDEEKVEKYYTMLDGASKLIGINPDTIGFLRIPTKGGGDPIIELPVVQAHDNMKYLDRNFNGEESRTGTLFLDFRNRFDRVEDHRLVEENSDHLVIYGHNMADESMFGKLKYYYGSADYYTEHPIIQLNSNYESYTYKIFAIFIVDAKDESETKYDCWNQVNLDTEEDFYNFVNEAKRRTIYTNDVDVKYGDQLLSLSTCHYLLQDRSRLMIMARSVRPGEDLYEGTEKSKKNKNIKWPSMYYNSKPNEKYDEKAIFIPYGPEEAVKEAEAKLEAQKKKKEEEKKKKEKASLEAEKAKSTTTKKSASSKKNSSKTKSKTTTAVKTKTAAEG